jgi:hypothetical protein
MQDSDFVFDDPEHFEEGLVHLADMLELSDPRRDQAQQSQTKVLKTGLTVPVGGTYEDWRTFCEEILSRLKATRPKIDDEMGQAYIDAAIDRIEQIIE